MISNSSHNNLDIKYFTSSKFIIFAGFAFSQIFSINTFYKKHILDGITKASIDRFGFGLNFKIF